MIEANYVPEGSAKLLIQSVKSIGYENKKYYLIYNYNVKPEQLSRERILELGWEHELKLLERKLKLEKLLS